MRKRWLILLVDVAGGIHEQTRFWTRRGAEGYASEMRSPLYDVILCHPNGSREMLFEHMDPNDLLKHVRETGRAPDLFPHHGR